MSSDKIMRNEDNLLIRDIAVLFTLGTSLMYLLGWTYWKSFFWYFGISQEFIDLSFEQIISTTWRVGFTILFTFVFLVSRILDENIKRTDIFLFLVAIFYIYLLDKITLLYALGLLLVFFIIIHLVPSVPFFQKEISIKKMKKTGWVLILIFAIFVLMFFYNNYGKLDAEKIHTNNTTRIIVETSEGWQTPQNAFLISHMDGKYFIYNSNSQNLTREVFIIEDSRVTKVTLLKNN